MLNKNLPQKWIQEEKERLSQEIDQLKFKLEAHRKLRREAGLPELNKQKSFELPEKTTEQVAREILGEILSSIHKETKEVRHTRPKRHVQSKLSFGKSTLTYKSNH